MLHTFLGGSQGDEFGISVAGPGDVDGDGHDDLFVGAWMADGGASDAGAATVFSGLDGSVLYEFQGQGANDGLGQSVGGAGDFDGDSVPDLIVGASSDEHGVDSGSARIYSGADGSLLMILYGDSMGDRFGVAVSGAGDVDADGISDVIIGATFDDDGGDNAGSAHVYAGLEFVRIYCTPKPGLACGVPAIGFDGVPSLSASSDSSFPPVRRVVGARVLIYSDAGGQTYRSGRTLCVAAPLRRGPLVDSEGMRVNAMGVRLDLNAFASGRQADPAAFL